jgi:hypothetical protein
VGVAAADARWAAEPELRPDAAVQGRDAAVSLSDILKLALWLTVAAVVVLTVWEW